MDIQKFNAIVAAAKTKAANDPKWLRGIEKAAAAILSGEMIVTTLATGALVTTPGGTYTANGACDCPARTKHCYHRAGARLMAIYEEKAPVAVSRPILPLRDDETRNTCVVCGNSWTANYTSDYCPIHAKQDPARWRPSPARERATLIASILSAWPRRFPTDNLADNLMARFRVNSLNFLADDMLQAVRAAIAL